MSQAILKLRNLRTVFQTQEGVVKAVDDISFDLFPGKVLGVVGESGCGKSVTARSILRLIQSPPGFIDQGQIIFNDKDLLKLSQKEMETIRGNEISMIFQDPMTSLNPFLTVETQLTEVLEVHQGKTHAQARKTAIEMLEKVGIPDAPERLRQYPHEFSGGMRQRVMIGMALLCRPKILIADEPTTALDVTIQAQTLKLINELRKEFGTAVILITHDLGIIAGLADEVAVMYAGKIVEYGPTEDIFSSGHHPYTEGLLKSIPRLDDSLDQILEPIPGLPPDLSKIPTGCAFHPRCPIAESRCKNDDPSKVQLATEHWASCWKL